MANGIQASGERLRKKLTIGSSARRAFKTCPSQRPAGRPNSTASAKPQLTRKKETTRSFGSRELRSSPRARRTARGEGKALSWNRPDAQTSVQTPTSKAATARGSRTERCPAGEEGLDLAGNVSFVMVDRQHQADGAIGATGFAVKAAIGKSRRQASRSGPAAGAAYFFLSSSARICCWFWSTCCNVSWFFLIPFWLLLIAA